jgi:CheY-like chemotaxis protein
MADKAKVLVIDDDKDFVASVRALLESNGYDVVDASSGKEGLKKVLEESPDVIMLDIMMETSVEGYSVHAALKNKPEYKDHKSTPVIMVSSIESSPDERFSPKMVGEVGMITPAHYMTKPLDIPKFLELLKKVLGND